MNIYIYIYRISEYTEMSFLEPKIKEIYHIHEKEKDNCFFYMKVDHDGVDEDGYESNLYTLYIYDQKNQTVHCYHCEQWYDSRDDDRFYLLKEIPAKKFFQSHDFNTLQLKKNDFKPLIKIVH